MRRLDALRAMARQDVSPHERDIAREKLQAMGEGWDEPPHRPPAAPAPGGGFWYTTTTTSNSAGHGTFGFNFTITFDEV